MNQMHAPQAFNKTTLIPFLCLWFRPTVA